MRKTKKTDIFIHLWLPGLLALLACSSLSAAMPPLTNQLKNHPSPYLALHGNDPVHWQDWGAEVVERAKAENKLIFISSGYFSCHWCHVMQEQSYSNQAVADLLNKLAIPVKIDRELLPALDSWLINFTETTTGQAGWPLNVFLTPKGFPLIGMTYLPKKNFSDLLSKLQTRWQAEEAHLKTIAVDAFKSMQPSPQEHSGKPIKPGMDKALIQFLILQAMQAADDIAGGFGDQNKFPMSPQLMNLIEVQASFPDDDLGAFLQLTLDQMAQLGLRDHVGGGFYRYTVDPAWDIPHFEKMLYDNAQLIGIYLRAAEVFKLSRYRQVALNTLDFVLDILQSPTGGYYASLSAVDDKNIEGGYYLWQIDELKSILNQEEFKVITALWGAKGKPYLEAGHHVKFVMSVEDAAQQFNLSIAKVRKIVSQAKQKLKRARTKRNLPVDTKVLAAWNGLLLNSLSKAAFATGSARYHRAAENLFKLLSERLWNGEHLSRFIHNDKPAGRVSLEDYAFVSQGITAWASVSKDAKAWAIARQIGLAGLQRFHTKNGWQLSEALAIPYDARELVLTDHTLPSPSATLLSALHDIADHQEDAQLKQRISQFIDIDLSEVASAPFWYGSHILLIHQVLQE